VYQIPLSLEKAIYLIGDVARDLCHPQSIRLDRHTTDSTRRVESSMKKRTTNRFNPVGVQTSIVKKSDATIRSQCRVRNSFQVVFRLRVPNSESTNLSIQQSAVVAISDAARKRITVPEHG
jgi:hypothetical protein